ncbi:hypothetical protein C5955_03660 [Cronobacter sakazakii]|nr:hypothetical protein C5955_03660 [Cronobacter sakazakii]
MSQITHYSLFLRQASRTRGTRQYCRDSTLSATLSHSRVHYCSFCKSLCAFCQYYRLARWGKINDKRDN